MTLLDALLSRGDPVESRNITPSAFWGAWARGDDATMGESEAGVRVTRETALALSAVWGCVSLIADSISTLPVDAYTQNKDGSLAIQPRPSWLDAPNPEQTKVEYIFGTVASLLLDGCAPIYTLRNKLGDVVETYALDPRWVQIRREPQPDGTLAIVYYVMVGKGMQSPVGPFRVVAGPEMFHINAFNPNSNWPRGIPPLEVARLMFGGAIAGQEMGARFFGRGMNAAGFIENPNDMTDRPGQAAQGRLHEREQRSPQDAPASGPDGRGDVEADADQPRAGTVPRATPVQRGGDRAVLPCAAVHDR